jgi:hypothetical protein
MGTSGFGYMDTPRAADALAWRDLGIESVVSGIWSRLAIVMRLVADIPITPTHPTQRADGTRDTETNRDERRGLSYTHCRTSRPHRRANWVHGP